MKREGVKMKQNKIYPKEWMQIHPYVRVGESDEYFVGLANRLYAEISLSELPDEVQRKLALYVAAYLEDLVSGLGLWDSFRREHQRLYGCRLPFYSEGAAYEEGEPNVENVCFLIWNTWQKGLFPHEYIDPMHPDILRQAQALMPALDEAYEEAPENEALNGFFGQPGSEQEADRKLDWLFGHTYLTEPAMAPYIERVTPGDRFIIPTGPLALFLYEWIDLLSGSEDWKKVRGLYLSEPVISSAMKEKNRTMYQNFTAATEGYPLVYLEGYGTLRRFLIEVLKWQDDDNHTLPHLKAHRNFILMTNEEKGILLAKDICEYIADEKNPLYKQELAEANAFRLLTEETLCPPDLLTYCLKHCLLPDVHIPGSTDRELAGRNADFIARHALLYYYRGD